MKKQRIKIVVDVLMTAALLLLMPYEMIGEALHEWIGAGMFLLFVIHHILNRRWTGNLTKGRYTPLRVIQTLLVFLILICMLGSMASGIILSRHLFAFLNIRGFTSLAGTVHMTCAYWGFVLMSLHLGIHWRMMVGMASRAFGKPSGLRSLIARLAGLAIGIYGIYAFIKRGIPGYLFLQVHFVFFDYSEPVIFFILDYVAAMGLFVLIGHYLAKGLTGGRRKQKNETNKNIFKKRRINYESKKSSFNDVNRHNGSWPAGRLRTERKHPGHCDRGSHRAVPGDGDRGGHRASPGDGD